MYHKQYILIFEAKIFYLDRYLNFRSLFFLRKVRFQLLFQFRLCTFCLTPATLSAHQSVLIRINFNLGVFIFIYLLIANYKIYYVKLISLIECMLGHSTTISKVTLLPHLKTCILDGSYCLPSRCNLYLKLRSFLAWILQ